MKHFQFDFSLSGMTTYAITITSVASASRTANTNWGGGKVPTATDDVVIASGTHVIINDNVIALQKDNVPNLL